MEFELQFEFEAEIEFSFEIEFEPNAPALEKILSVPDRSIFRSKMECAETLQQRLLSSATIRSICGSRTPATSAARNHRRISRGEVPHREEPNYTEHTRTHIYTHTHTQAHEQTTCTVHKYI